MIPTINRPTRVTANTATAIDHIIISTIISSIQHRPGITNADISDHFPIVFALSTCEKSKLEDKTHFIYNGFYGENKNRVIQAWTKSDWIEQHY